MQSAFSRNLSFNSLFQQGLIKAKDDSQRTRTVSKGQSGIAAALDKKAGVQQGSRAIEEPALLDLKKAIEKNCVSLTTLPKIFYREDSRGNGDYYIISISERQGRFLSF